jgi:hypothetical protein
VQTTRRHSVLFATTKTVRLSQGENENPRCCLKTLYLQRFSASHGFASVENDRQTAISANRNARTVIYKLFQLVSRIILI